ncbi:retrotransposon protein, putative, ty1-copia subclass [Tanacetum coccineum]
MFESHSNFSDWFRSPKLVLRVEKKLSVIEQPIPPAHATDSEAQVLAKWNVVYDAHNEELKSMFEKQARVERFDLNLTFHACKQEEGKSVSPYVLKMKGYVEQLEQLGYVLLQDLSVGLIINGLTSDFAGFVRNYNMHNIRKTISELHALLIEYEKGLPKKAATPQPKNPKPSAKEHLAKDDACHHCKQVGHWKRNCPVYLAELVMKKKQVDTANSSSLKGVSKNDVLYFNVIPCNDIYEIDMLNLVPNVNSIYNVSNKIVKHNLDSTYLWHCRLSHISNKRIKKLQHDRLLMSTDEESFYKYVSCLLGKMTWKPFPHHTKRATDLLRLIHTDVCGPLRHVSRQGASYFITFMDDYSHYDYVYLLKHKHEVFETFKVLKNKVGNQLEKTIKALRSDRGGEYISQEFKDYLKSCGIIQQLTPLYTPQHNGVSERRNYTLLDMVRSMMNLTTLPLSFWDYALEFATRILNMVPTKKVDKTPYELWIPKETICYYFYFPPKNKIVVARYAVFLEKNLISQEFSGRAVELEEIQDEDTSPSENTSEIPMEVEGFEPPQEEVVPVRRFARTHRAPNRLCLNVKVEDHSLGDLNEPANYKAIILDPESNKWLGAMNAEMQSMKDNQVWCLVKLPPNGKTVGINWRFKKKTDMYGIVHTYKDRLIAKGFTQTYGIDYEETFSPVADIKAIRILIAIAAFYEYKIWQMDAKNSFLNGYLDENIYMVQPEGFVDPKHPRKICKFQRSIYGLKQASRMRNKRFDEEIKKFGFARNLDEPCAYQKGSRSNLTLLILYVDDIIIMGNHIPSLQSVKSYFRKCFAMKDLGEATFILGIKIYRDRSKRLIRLSQSAYMDKILKKYRMDNSKHGELHWIAVKTILKYLRNSKDMFLVYGGNPEAELLVDCYCDTGFETDRDDIKSQTRYVLVLNRGAEVELSVGLILGKMTISYGKWIFKIVTFTAWTLDLSSTYKATYNLIAIDFQQRNQDLHEFCNPGYDVKTIIENPLKKAPLRHNTLEKHTWYAEKKVIRCANFMIKMHSRLKDDPLKKQPYVLTRQKTFLHTWEALPSSRSQIEVTAHYGRKNSPPKVVVVNDNGGVKNAYPFSAKKNPTAYMMTMDEITLDVCNDLVFIHSVKPTYGADMETVFFRVICGQKCIIEDQARINKESKEFGRELFDSLARRYHITGESINKEQLREFKDHTLQYDADIEGGKLTDTEIKALLLDQKIVVVVGTVTNYVKVDEILCMRATDLRFTKTAIARTENARVCLTFDQLALRSPFGQNTIWVKLKGKACSFMLCDLDFEPLSLSLSSLPSCDLMSLTNMLILLHYLESFKSEFAEVYVNRGSKRRRSGKEPESTSALRETTTTTAGKTTTGSKTHKQSASQSAPVEETMQSTDVFEAPAHQEFETGVHDEQAEEEVHHLPDWFQQPKRLPSPDHAWNKSVPAVHESVQPWLSNLARRQDPQESFDELTDTTFDFSAFVMNRLNVKTLTPELLAGPTFELMKGTCKSLTELEYFCEEVYKATTEKLDWINPEGRQYPHDLRKPLPLVPNSQGRHVIPFHHFINNDLEYLRGGESSRKYSTSVTKTTAADYGHIKWIEDLVPNSMWSQMIVNYDKFALWGISHWGKKRRQFYAFATTRESARDVYSKRRIIAVTKVEIVEWQNYKHLDWITYQISTLKNVIAFNAPKKCSQEGVVIKGMWRDLNWELTVEAIRRNSTPTKPDTYPIQSRRQDAYNTPYS